MDLSDFSKVIFYNHGHNGDLHYSREFIKRISKSIAAPCYRTGISRCYLSHNKPKSLLSDLNLDLIPISDWDPDAYNSNGWWGFTVKPKSNIYVVKDSLYINTWIGQQNFRWVNAEGICLRNYYKMMSNTMSLLNITLEEEHHYIPSIDYSSFEIDNVRVRQEKNIFISNGDVFSGQSKNFDMSELIIELAKEHKDCDFYVTEKIETDVSNVIDANKLTGKPFQKYKGYGGGNGGGVNVNELSYLSTFCDIIVGRASGPYGFTHTKQNLFNPKKTFICFGENLRTCHWALLSDYSVDSKAKQTWVYSSPNSGIPEEEEKISTFEHIDSEIRQRYR